MDRKLTIWFIFCTLIALSTCDVEIPDYAYQVYSDEPDDPKPPTPAPQSSCTATVPVAHHDRMCQLPSAIRYSTSFIPSATPVLRQWLNSSSNVSCGQQFKQTAALGPELANSASAPRFLATPSLQLATSPSLLLLPTYSHQPSRPSSLLGRIPVLPYCYRPFHALARSRPNP